MKKRDLQISPQGTVWTVKDAGPGSPAKLYPNKLAAVSAARRMLNEAGSGSVTVHRTDGRIESREDIDPERGRTSYRLTPKGNEISAFEPAGNRAGTVLSDDTLLLELSMKTGESPDEVIRKALALYEAATEAVEQGKAVGIANDPKVLESEFVGF